jgi:hypothetical protein
MILPEHVERLWIRPARVRAKAGEVAGGRGGAVDPHVGAVDWEDKAASTLLRFLIGYGEAGEVISSLDSSRRKARRDAS